MMKLYELYEKVAEMNEKHKICKITVPHDLTVNCCKFVIVRKDRASITNYWTIDGESCEAGRSSCIITEISELQEYYEDDIAYRLEKMIEYAEKNINHFDESKYMIFREKLKKQKRR